MRCAAFSKKKKRYRSKFGILHKENCLYRRNDNISRGCATKMEFLEGRGGHFCEPILENPEGRGSWEKSFSVRGMDIFWNYTMLKTLFRAMLPIVYVKLLLITNELLTVA